MARITLGRQVVDTSQIKGFVLARKNQGKNLVFCFLCFAVAMIVYVSGPHLASLSPWVFYGAGFVAFAASLVFAVSAVTAPYVLDIVYAGGRATRVDCISREHGEQVKADLLARMGEGA